MSNLVVQPRWREWLQDSIWPQISTMMLHDAFFKLFAYVHESTGQFNGPFANLLITGYVSNQTVTIRRLCDGRRDVISLRKLVEDLEQHKFIPIERSKQLLSYLDTCDHICDLVNDHIAHTANPNRRNVSPWSLQDKHIAEAQKSICRVAIALTRDIMKTHVGAIIPVIQDDFMREFKTMVSPEQAQKLFDFWHLHSESVDRWCEEPLRF